MVTVRDLMPDTGTARVEYILGYQTRKLIQVNVIWGDEKAKDQTDSNALVTAGTRLERYFAGPTSRSGGRAPRRTRPTTILTACR